MNRFLSQDHVVRYDKHNGELEVISLFGYDQHMRVRLSKVEQQSLMSVLVEINSLPDQSGDNP